MRETVKVLFASGSEDLIPTAIEHMRQLLPEIPLVVVSEFPPGHQRWVPFPVARGFRDNLALCRWHFRDKNVRLSAVILQPRMPYWRMRWIGFLISPWNFLAMNENFGHFMLRPQSAGNILRHVLWRTRNFFVWEFSPGGTIYTFLWRLAHPKAFFRPMQFRLARLTGWVARVFKPSVSGSPLDPAESARPRGISVVIPSRDGNTLLERALPEAMRQIEMVGGEIIVVDNGSSDATADFLRDAYPNIAVDAHPEPLSFARAVNAGIRRARYSHVCLLNNDMVIEEGFFAALLDAFENVPDLFCATAQIFFPDGQRREETGKAIMPRPEERERGDFPLRCDLAISGEDLSYVLYGSGGCSLYEAGKLAALGGMDEVYEPAYVEDLDLGFRAWRQGWPSVFVSAARVEHRHRATTSRYFSREYLDQVLELNYLRFLARAVSDPALFRRLWNEAVARLNLLAVQQKPNRAAATVLSTAWRVPFRRAPVPRARIPEGEILALTTGEVVVTPGRPASGRPRLMIASPYVPFPLSHGGAVRMYNLMRRAAADFDQVLVTFGGDRLEPPAELLEFCCEVVTVRRPGTHLLPSTARPDVVEEFESPAFHAALRQTVRKWSPKVAQLEFTQMAQYATDCAPAKTILVEHDVTFDLYRQLLAQGDDWELRRQLDRWIPFETRAWQEMDCVVAMSERDRKLMLSHGASSAKSECLANGVDLERFQPAGPPDDARGLLFIGSFAHLPNLMALDFFLREVWPGIERYHPSLHVIAGARHEYFLERYRERVRLDLDRPCVEVEDFVADVRPAYRRAAVVIAPLVASAGTNIKIMEAMAMGKAIVSSKAGVNGLDLHPDRDIIVTGSGEDMAQAIARLFDHPEQRESLEREARRSVEQEFNWDTIAARQKDLYSRLMS